MASIVEAKKKTGSRLSLRDPAGRGPARDRSLAGCGLDVGLALGLDGVGLDLRFVLVGGGVELGLLGLGVGLDFLLCGLGIGLADRLVGLGFGLGLVFRVGLGDLFLCLGMRL